MSARSEKEVEIVPQQEITFRCKYCGESKPIAEMVVMKQYFPQLVACRTCSVSIRNRRQDSQEAEIAKPVESNNQSEQSA